ncbi:hypothetical protein SAMN05421824_1042 [Hyunsoonleella jejuensis]|uniref:Uncharacterized protein n=1 Tax=Hyunsoonleella jejuensis TaxID=419940 RepID=A0A1H9CWS6_9FLAO|nr:hypothetical protein [Hyunsoonleella jejuensis]SEQ05601.1 hypothetical protein SAMN05421824_1042 [Hyunsoonleella jejuensis]
MKTLLITLAFICILDGVQSQNQTQVTDFHFSDNITNTFSVDNALKLFEWIDLAMIPQLGGLFATTFNTVAPNLKWQDWYNDFDFGFNAQAGWKPNEKIKIQAFYNIGMLKFNNNLGEASGYNFKISINFNF